MAGRPSVYRDELFQEITTRLSEGESLKQICKDAHMPSRASVMKWLAENTQLSDKYARARELCADRWFDELREYSEKAIEEPRKTQAYKLKIETDKWILARMSPKKYGDLGEIAERKQSRPKFPFEDADTQDLRDKAETPGRFFA